MPGNIKRIAPKNASRDVIDKDFKTLDVDVVSRIDGRNLYTKEEWEAKRKKILGTPLP